MTDRLMGRLMTWSIAGDGLRTVAIQGHFSVGEDDGTGGDVPLDGPRGEESFGLLFCRFCGNALKT